jgi:hypothetical protein
MLDGLIDKRAPPLNWEHDYEGGKEHHLTEGAVMVAFAMNLLRTIPDLGHVAIHPDGEHGKQFPFSEWLTANGFKLTKTQGRTNYGGLYSSLTSGQSILVNPSPGQYDVIADIAGISFAAECKGGVINSRRHPGRLSRLRKGLCEAVGQLLSKEPREGMRQFAVVPLTSVTEKLGLLMAPRVAKAGIEIALVDAVGEVHFVL